MNLLLVWLCPNCLTPHIDTACDNCGRPLTANDLTPITHRTDARTPTDQSEGTGVRQENTR